MNRSMLLLCLLLPGVATAQGEQRCDYHDPMWLPSGERIAFYSNRSGDFDVYTIRPDGSDLFNVTRHPARDLSLAHLVGVAGARSVGMVVAEAPNPSDVGLLGSVAVVPQPARGANEREEFRRTSRCMLGMLSVGSRWFE